MPAIEANDGRALAWKPQAILLIDGDERRRLERAASMRRHGVVVDCADDAAAGHALWQPEKYKLVLFELSGAAKEMRAFCVSLQELSPRQKIGIYRSTHPFIEDARFPSSHAAAEPPRQIGNRLQDTLAAAARCANAQTGLIQAAQQIAALRPRPTRPTAPPDRPERESYASVAARVLGGEQ